MFRAISLALFLMGSAAASRSLDVSPHPHGSLAQLKVLDVTVGGRSLRKHREDPAPPEGTAKAPEQGFEGDNVQHVDMDTATGDWRREYGPKGPPKHPAAEMKSGAMGTSLLGSLAALGLIVAL